MRKIELRKVNDMRSSNTPDGREVKLFSYKDVDKKEEEEKKKKQKQDNEV